MMIPRFSSLFRLLWWVCFLTGAACGEVSLNPPPEYEESLAPLLTPFEEIAKAKDPSAGKDEGGTIRLTENVTRVHEDGTYLRAIHSITQPYTQKGAEDSATRRVRFQSHVETVHVVKARTVLPDGTEKTLGPNALFIQKGERGSDSIYDDGQDLVLIFPDVKPGAKCELIVVVERTKPSVTGGYSEFMDWNAGWPIGLKRRVVDLPAAWAPRVKVETVGKRPVTPSELPAVPGRWRKAWQREALESGSDEPEESPGQQAGPGTWLTTFGSWDEVAAWYGGLLEERSDLGDILKAKVDEWTKDAKSPREILTILHDHAANDVRYEGLEFGLSGLQPYACDTVWKNQYGDCKDKANLLAAMLRHKGMSAKVVLVNTEHAGLVAKNIPDYQHFNHAITVAELKDDKGAVTRVFCDATIAHGRPGLLSPGDADRDVLAINGAKAEWLHTPPAPSGESHYAFDLDMTAEGRVSGWLTIKSTGFNGVQMARVFSGIDRDTAKQKLHSYAASFFPGAEVMDFVLPGEKREVDEAEMKIYFTTPARQLDSAGRLSLPFPWAKWQFSDFGEGKDRRTAYFQTIDRIRVTSKIRLPEGWQPESLPSPLKLDTPPFQASARWSHAKGVCETEMDLHYRESLIPAEKVAAPAQANRAMFAWLQAPLALKQGAGNPLAGIPKAGVEMPLMPTGKGQMSLVDRWYPSNGDPAKREAALEQVMRFFPNDPETIYYARTELAVLKYETKKYEAALTALQELLARKPEGVGVEYIAYSRYFQGLALQKMSREADAVAAMKALAADESVSGYRRNWAARFAGEWLAKQKPVPTEALDLLKQASQEEDCRDDALSLRIPAMVAAGKGDALVAAIADGSLFEGLEDDGAAVMEQVTAQAKGGDKTAAGELLPWLRKALDAAQGKPSAKPLAAACTALESWSTRGDTYNALRKEALAMVEASRPDDLKNPAIDTYATPAAALSGMEEVSKKDSKALLAMAGGFFRKFEAGDQFPRALWLYLTHLKAVEHEAGSTSETALFPKLVETGCKLPHDDRNYWECLFLKTGWLQDQGKHDEALVIFRTMPDDASFNPLFEKPLWNHMGESYEAQGKWKEAIGCYVKFKEDRREFKSVVEHLLRAGILMARSGDREEALDLWKLLADVPESVYASSSNAAEIRDAIALAATPKETLQQWDATERWWKQTFVPYVRSLNGALPNRPPLFLSEGADDLNLRCRKAVAEKDLKTVLAELSSVAFTSRWLPSMAQSVNVMLEQFVKPLAPNSERANQSCFAGLVGTVRTGDPSVVQLCQRYDAAYSYDLGKPEHTLEVMDGQWKEAPGRTMEHRERCAWLFTAAAAATNQKVDVALETSTWWMEHSAGFIHQGQWAPVHADLLIRSGRRAEAIAFLKSKAARPEVKGKNAVVTPILEKLSQLEAQGDGKEGLASVVEAILKKHKPAWYDYVGPKDLSDPRIGDPNKALNADLSRFHPCELFRLHLLLAQSADVDLAVRERALTTAAIDLGKQQTTWNQAVAIWRELLDQQKLSSESRLQMLWKFACELVPAGQVEALAELRKAPVFSAYSTAYAERYFPMLEQAAKGMRDGPAVLKEALSQLNSRELDRVDFTVADMFYSGLLSQGDTAGADAAREALKNWKLQPAVAGDRNSKRLLWMRMGNQAKTSLAFHQAMLDLFREALEPLAQKASAGWRQRIDLEEMRDLKDSDYRAIDAARIISGFRFDKSSMSEWFMARDTWLASAGKADAPKIAAVCRLLESVDDQIATMALGTILYSLAPMQDQDEAVIDEALKAFHDPAKHPLANGVVSYWQNARHYRAGMPLEVEKLTNIINRHPSFLRRNMRIGLLESLWVNGDFQQTAKHLDAITSDEKMDADGFSIYLPLLQEMKRTEELEIASEDAARCIQEQVMDSWRDHNPHSFQRACDLALLCNRKDLLPEAWLASMPGQLAMDHDKAFARAQVARLKGDWKAMKAELETVKDLPDREKQHLAWFMSCALDGLGEKGKAIESARQCLSASNIGNRYFLAAGRYLRSVGVDPAKPAK